jgi:hypothetical protein
MSPRSRFIALRSLLSPVLAMRALVAALLSAAMLCVVPQAQASCNPHCISASVFNAAGMPPKVSTLLSSIVFNGENVDAAGRTAVRDLAAELKAQPIKGGLQIVVAADDALSGKAAAAQAQARAKNLRTLLTQQGLKPAAVTVTVAKGK